MDGVVINCPAKVNLALAVLGRDERAGMHFIDSVVAKISLSDRLTLSGGQGEGFTTSFTFAPGVREEPIDPCGNTITRAHAAVEEVLGITLPPLAVSVEKRIPVGGGLGGGSSDAAGFIFGLRDLAELGMLGGAGEAVMKAGEDDWYEIAQAIGMDTHIFLTCHDVIRVQGFGEVITPVELPILDRFFCAVIDPGVSLSTRDMYSRVQFYSTDGHVEAFLQEWRAQALSNMLHPSLTMEIVGCLVYKTRSLKELEIAMKLAKNDFTDIARNVSKEVTAVLDEYEGRFPLVALTGSGSCVIAVGSSRMLSAAGLTPYSFLIEPASPD
jgi:4-diphosphocytidyl-2C-methyl-D-erythritol kinase